MVSISTAATLGKIDEFIIDPRTRAVVAVTLKRADHADTLRWKDITVFGADAVTVSGDDQLTETTPELAGLSAKDHRVIGKRVLATTGDELGMVDDVEFDPTTGAITGLLLASGVVAGTRLIGVGSYAVVVQAAIDGT
ncbi:MAG: PRC-barrel domain-containing protein [Jatrophihabitans sp.]